MTQRGRKRFGVTKKGVFTVAGIAATGVILYETGKIFIAENLPSFLETELSYMLNREVKVGEVESLSLSHVNLGSFSIPPTPTDSDHLFLEGVEVKFNLLGLFRGELPATVTLLGVDGYIYQGEKGNWLDLELNLTEIPIKLDVTVKTESADFTLLPLGKITPLLVSVSGESSYNEKSEQLQYDLVTDIGKGEVKIKGETETKTGKTDASLMVNNLQLPELVTLIPNSPVSLNDGELNADLKLNLTAFNKLTSLNIEGEAYLTEILGQAETIFLPVAANAAFAFAEDTVKINSAKVSLGDMVTKIAGEVGLEKGYDLNLQVLFDLANLASIPVSLPVDMQGEMQLLSEVRGEIDNPQVTGKLNNTQPVYLDKIELKTVKSNFRSDLDNFELETFQAFLAEGGKVTANGRVEMGLRESLSARKTPDIETMPFNLNFNAVIPTNPIITAYELQPEINPIITALGEIKGTGNNPEALVTWEMQSIAKKGGSLEGLEGKGAVILKEGNLQNRANLAVGKGEVRVNGRYNLTTNNWESSILATAIETKNLLTGLCADFSCPNIEDAQINVSGNKLENITGLAQVQMNVYQGEVIVDGSFQENQWEADVKGEGINILALCEELKISCFEEILGKEKLNAQVSLLGNIETLVESLVQENSTISTTPITINNLEVNLGENLLTGEGRILLSNLFSSPDIANLGLNLNLNLTANSNLATIPLSQVAVTGKAYFQGRLEGKNLLTLPFAPGNLQLNGGLNLTDLTINGAQFESSLSGKTELSREKVEIDLRGENDVIAASLKKCENPECLLPYVPSILEVKQGENVRVEGKEKGNQFFLEVEKFPLGLLNLYPGIKGEVKAKLDINPYTLESQGNLEIKQPGIDNIQAETLQANFTYGENQGKITSGYLKFGATQYDFTGGLNLVTGELNGKLNMTTAYIEDILQTLQIKSIEDLISIFSNNNNESSIVGVKPNSVGKPNAAISQQINLLWEIEKQIKNYATKLLKEKIPTELDIQGNIRGEVILGGNLEQPEINFEIKGNKWDWFLYPSVVNVVKPLGVVTQQAVPLFLNEVVVKGDINKERITLTEAKLDVEEAILTFTGGVNSQEELLGEFQLENLSLELVRKFVDIPPELNGKITATGKMEGKINQPQIKGEVGFMEGEINGRSLGENLEGDFQYLAGKGEFCTREIELIEIKGMISLEELEEGEKENQHPSLCGFEETNKLYFGVKIGTKAITFLEALTLGNVEWVEGEGKVNLEVKWKDGKLQDNLNFTGEINLDNGIIASKIFQKQVKINGNIYLNNQLLTIDKIEGNLANTKIEIAGTLPLFKPEENNNNPLTIIINKGEMNLASVYQGIIDSKIVVTGAAIEPYIGGEINLTNGQIFVPLEMFEQEEVYPLLDKLVVNVSEEETLKIVPKINNLRIGLEELKIDEDLYRFKFGGDLIINGTLDNLENIKPEGKINLESGKLDIVTTQLFLNRNYDNKIEFLPKQGLLNPNLDLKLNTFLFDVSFRSINANEIREDLVNSGNAKTIELIVSVAGETEELVNSFLVSSADVCQIQPTDSLPFPGNNNLNSQELAQLTNCVEVSANESEFSFENLLLSPIVKLRSSPPLSNSEILALFGKQFFQEKQELQELNQNQLLEFGFTQVILGPIIQAVGFEFNQITSRVGKGIGATELRVFPIVESIYQIDQDSFMRLSYDYNFNEFQVRYQVRF